MAMVNVKGVNATVLAMGLLMAALSDATLAANERAASQQRCVVLLHGLGRTAMSMAALSWSLQRQGYQVVNRTYPSLTRPIEWLAESAVGDAITECHQRGAGRIDVVTHSLGGILLRYYVSRHGDQQLGRVVMLGPPNRGSKLADALMRQAWFPSWAPPAARQLGTGAGSVPAQLGAVDFELGVVAGTRNLRPLLMATTDSATSSASDGTVLVEETRVRGMTDFQQLPVSHTLMMWSPTVIAEVRHFLREGKFTAR